VSVSVVVWKKKEKPEKDTPTTEYLSMSFCGRSGSEIQKMQSTP
jgi:hypothetical protein